jgi:nucleoside-diphosphate-sugar epimerase
MSRTQIFLTGATGYIGRQVVSEFVRRNFAITALVRRPTELHGCRVVVGDLTSVNRLLNEVGEADGIVHLATSRSFIRQAVMSEIHANALLIDAWRKGPFIFASSASIEGWNDKKLQEDSPAWLHNWYGMGKFCNEFQLRVASPTYQRGATISLRPAGLVIGANDCRALQQRFGMFYSHCKLGSKFVFRSEELLERSGSSFIGTADLGRTFADSMMIKVSGAYNVAAGFCTWKSLIENVNRIAGTHSNVIIRQNGDIETGEFLLPQSRTCLDDSAFKTQVGFVPQQSVEQLIHEFVAADERMLRKNRS